MGMKPSVIPAQMEGPDAIMADDVELDLPAEGEEFQTPPGEGNDSEST
jgi:hypothetical protein